MENRKVGKEDVDNQSDIVALAQPVENAATIDSYKNECPLVWMRHQLPATLGDLLPEEEEPEEDAMETTSSSLEDFWPKTEDGQAVAKLQAQVASYEAQLEAEAQANAKCQQETAQYRQKLDEWTTMISMVRQETEAVLYRHNVLQQDPSVSARAEQKWKEEQKAHPTVKETPKEEAEEEANDEAASTTPDEPADADSGLKRSAPDEAEEEAFAGRSKRRKV